MCRVLILMKESVFSDPEKEARKFDRYDPVTIKPDGWVWGVNECLPKFACIDIPGVSVADAAKYLLANTVNDATVFAGYRIVKHRLWNIEVETIPTAIKNQLKTTGQVTVTLAQIRGYIRNRVTGNTD
jgi:hypothetical protein